jgi:hypothetical protein
LRSSSVIRTIVTLSNRFTIALNGNGPAPIKAPRRPRWEPFGRTSRPAGSRLCALAGDLIIAFRRLSRDWGRTAKMPFGITCRGIQPVQARSAWTCSQLALHTESAARDVSGHGRKGLLAKFDQV